MLQTAKDALAAVDVCEDEEDEGDAVNGVSGVFWVRFPSLQVLVLVSSTFLYRRHSCIGDIRLPSTFTYRRHSRTVALSYPKLACERMILTTPPHPAHPPPHPDPGAIISAHTPPAQLDTIECWPTILCR